MKTRIPITVTKEHLAPRYGSALPCNLYAPSLAITQQTDADVATVYEDASVLLESGERVETARLLPADGSSERDLLDWLHNVLNGIGDCPFAFVLETELAKPRQKFDRVAVFKAVDESGERISKMSREERAKMAERAYRIRQGGK